MQRGTMTDAEVTARAEAMLTVWRWLTADRPTDELAKAIETQRDALDALLDAAHRYADADANVARLKAEQGEP